MNQIKTKQHTDTVWRDSQQQRPLLLRLSIVTDVLEQPDPATSIGDGDIQLMGDGRRIRWLPNEPAIGQSGDFAEV
jgi:hypothetical protein